jgi:hypothetical protein
MEAVKGKRMMKIKILGLLLLAVLGNSGSLLAQESLEDQCIQKFGLWDPTTQKCTLNPLQIKVNYPLGLPESPLVKSTVDDFLLQTQLDFLALYSASYSMEFPYPWSLIIDYETFQFSTEIFTINFMTYDYTGGAHGNTYFKTFTFDLPNERILTLGDIFLPESNPYDVISPIVQTKLAETLGEMSDPTWIEGGTGLNPDNYQFFALTETSLIFLFPPYQVAAYAAGPQRVEIPLADLAAILRPEFVP